MIDVRTVPLRSWLNPATAGSLSHGLRSRLEERMRGRKGLFLTLTYGRTEYGSPLDLYRAQSAERHVRRFIKRLERFLEVSLEGRWIRKMEFQDGGWVHFHIVLDFPDRIPHDVLAELWGHGFVFVTRVRPKHIGYMSKYAAKTGDMPGFLLAERVRSIKIIATSPGFWFTRRESKPSVKKPPCAVYMPLAMRLKKPPVVVIREASMRWYRTFRVDLAQLLRRLRESGIACVPGQTKWIGFDAPWRRVVLVARQLERETAAAEPQAGGGFTRSLYRNPPPPPEWLADLFASDGIAEWEWGASHVA